MPHAQVFGHSQPDILPLCSPQLFALLRKTIMLLVHRDGLYTIIVTCLYKLVLDHMQQTIKREISRNTGRGLGSALGGLEKGPRDGGHLLGCRDSKKFSTVCPRITIIMFMLHRLVCR